MATDGTDLKAKAENWLLGLPPLGRIFIGTLPAVLLVIALEILWVQPERQALRLLRLQEHAQQLRLDRLRHEVRENADLETLAEETRKRLLKALAPLQSQDPNSRLEALDRVLSQGGVVLTEEPLIAPPPNKESPLTLYRVSSTIETHYPGLAWALAALALHGPPFSMEELTLKPLQAPKPGEMVREMTLTGKIGLIQVIARPDLIQDLPKRPL